MSMFYNGSGVFGGDRDSECAIYTDAVLVYFMVYLYIKCLIYTN